jgi:hypothetical protein
MTLGTSGNAPTLEASDSIVVLKTGNIRISGDTKTIECIGCFPASGSNNY